MASGEVAKSSDASLLFLPLCNVEKGPPPFFWRGRRKNPRWFLVFVFDRSYDPFHRRADNCEIRRSNLIPRNHFPKRFHGSPGNELTRSSSHSAKSRTRAPRRFMTPEKTKSPFARYYGWRGGPSTTAFELVRIPNFAMPADLFHPPAIRRHFSKPWNILVSTTAI